MPSNMLITHDVQHREAALEHARTVLEELGASPRFLADASPGIFEVEVAGPPRDLIRQASELCAQDPSRFAHTHHWRPVDAWTRSELPPMQDAMEQLAVGIAADDTWRLTLQIHGTSRWRTHQLMGPLTEVVRQGHVRMGRPEKEARVDVIRDRAAFALLEPGDDLSIDKVRQVQLAMPQEI